MTGPQFSFCTIPIHRVHILKFFLASPSGPAKNKKFKKWTQFSRGGLFFRAKIGRSVVLPLLLFIIALLLLRIFFHVSWISRQVEIVQKPVGSIF